MVISMFASVSIYGAKINSFIKDILEGGALYSEQIYHDIVDDLIIGVVYQ